MCPSSFLHVDLYSHHTVTVTSSVSFPESQVMVWGKPKKSWQLSHMLKVRWGPAHGDSSACCCFCRRALPQWSQCDRLAVHPHPNLFHHENFCPLPSCWHLQNTASCEHNSLKGFALALTVLWGLLVPPVSNILKELHKVTLAAMSSILCIKMKSSSALEEELTM